MLPSTAYIKQDPRITGKNNPLWKGENVGYRGLHYWIIRTLGKANKCENKLCKYPRKAYHTKTILAPTRYDWANISHQYKRELNDWVQLCRSCHQKADYFKYSLSHPIFIKI